VGHAARMGVMKINTTFWLRSLKGRDHFEDIDTNGRTILRWVLKKLGGRLWIGFTWLPIWASDGRLWSL
jgi:hypothetical protein